MQNIFTTGMKKCALRWSAALCVSLALLVSLPVGAAGPKPIILDPSYNHNRFGVEPRDIIRNFRAYTTSFDSLDDNNGDGVGDAWGIPEWVAYEIKRYDGDCIPTESRPSWFSDNELVSQGIAPTDKSYAYSQQWRKLHPDWYVRGHMAMKLIAERLGNEAAYNTHHVERRSSTEQV